MKGNPFEGKKILFSLPNNWFDGTTYKWARFMEENFDVETTRAAYTITPDLGMCSGDLHNMYAVFLKKKIPYLLVEHDVYSLRFGLNGKTYGHDKEKIENAVAVIFTSEDHAAFYEKLKKEEGWHIPEYVIINNRPLKKDTEFIPKKKVEGLSLVYAGGLVPSPNNGTPAGNYNYRAYHDIFSKFIQNGWNVYLYPNKTLAINHLREYEKIGCILKKWVEGNEIYKEMSQYTAGLQAYNRANTPEKAFQYAQLCRPNKLWDYLAAGIKTIGYHGGNGMGIYKDKWGIVLDDLEPETIRGIPERLNKIRITRKMIDDNVLEKEKGKFKYIMQYALMEAERKDRKMYIVEENPYKIMDTDRYPSQIKVYNKGVTTIWRGGYLFLPGKTSDILEVTMRTYKEIKSHVSLKIEIV